MEKSMEQKLGRLEWNAYAMNHILIVLLCSQGAFHKV